MKITDNLGSLLQHIAFSLGRQTDQVLLEQLGIGQSQFKIMQVLHKDIDVSQKHIADILGQTEASVSRQVKFMNRDGLVANHINPRNKREHLINLTTRGERIMEEAIKILNRYHQAVYETLSPRQQRQLMDSLTSMHFEVCKGNKPGRCYPSHLDLPL